MAKQEDLFKNVVSHAKSMDLFPSSEIYDGLSAVYDYAQNGVELKRTYANIGGSDGSNER
jgi:glycyl-tRNA synthetase